MATTWTQSSGDISATWSSSSGDIAATWTQSSGEVSASWDSKTLMSMGILNWEDVEDKYDNITTNYFSGVDANSGNWEDLG